MLETAKARGGGQGHLWPRRRLLPPPRPPLGEQCAPHAPGQEPRQLPPAVPMPPVLTVPGHNCPGCLAACPAGLQAPATAPISSKRASEAPALLLMVPAVAGPRTPPSRWLGEAPGPAALPTPGFHTVWLPCDAPTSEVWCVPQPCRRHAGPSRGPVHLPPFRAPPTARPSAGASLPTPSPRRPAQECHVGGLASLSGPPDLSWAPPVPPPPGPGGHRQHRCFHPWGRRVTSSQHQPRSSSAPGPLWVQTLPGLTQDLSPDFLTVSLTPGT